MLTSVQRELVGAHFLLLRRLLRKSTREDYAYAEPRNHIERRILLWLHRIEQGRVSQIAGNLGNDIAQVSRALTALHRAGLIQREGQRDPYRLTEAGMQIGVRLDDVAQRRERRLTAGFEPQEMFELAGLLSHLLQQAAVILNEQLTLLRDDALTGGEPPPVAPVLIPIYDRAHPLIIAIATTVSRYASAAFKRLTGTSSYEWRILASLAERPGLRFADLVTLLDSDKAQVSRALDSLAGSGLVERINARPGEAMRFSVSAEGHRVHDVMREDALRRNAQLIAGMTAAQRQQLQYSLHLLIANAEDMAGGPAATMPANGADGE